MTGRFALDCKTIADISKDNGAVICAVRGQSSSVAAAHAFH
jgi:hypothetical protein